MKRLVEFCHGDVHHVGVVTGAVGEKFEVLGIGGETFRVHPNEITAELGEGDETQLSEVVAKAAALVTDVAELWRLVVEAPRGYDLPELAE